MSLAYIHSFLRCRNSCAIPLPHPPLEMCANPQSKNTENRKVVVICPYCGLASAYSGRDVVQQVIEDKPSLFQDHECLLVSVEIECDSKDCEAPKVIYTVQGVATGTWRPKAVPKDWHFSDSARCEAGHKLNFEESHRLHGVTRADYPF